MSALCLYVCGLIVSTPLQGVAKIHRGLQKFSARFAHYLPPPPDQNAETARF